MQQRQLLRKLLPSRITVMPHVKGNRRWVDFHGDLALAPIISGIAPAVGDALPDDGGRRWWPQGTQETREPYSLVLPLAGKLAA